MTGWMVRWVGRAIVILDVALVVALAGTWHGQAVVNNAIDIWFDRSDETVAVFEDERRLFGADTWMLATVWMHADRIDRGTTVAREVSIAIERIEGVTRVVSPTTLEVLHDEAHGLFFDTLDPAMPWSRLRHRLVRHPVAGDLLVSPNAPDRFSLLIEEHTDASASGAIRQRIVADVRRVLDTHPAVAESALSGAAVINADLNRLSWRDFLTLMPGTALVASLALLGLVRFRWRTTVAILVPIGLATMGLLAAMLLVGRPFTMVTIALPGLLFTLGVASSLHVTRWVASWRAQGSADPLLVAAAVVRHLARPVAVSHATTALGFGLLAVVPVTPVQEMAAFGAAGVVVAGLHVLFVLPSLLVRWGAWRELAGARPLFAGEQAFASHLRRFTTRMGRLASRPALVLLPLGAAGLVVAGLIARVDYDSTYLHMIDPGERMREDYARLDAAHRPSAQLSVVVRRAAPDALVPASLNAALRAATTEIGALPSVSKVLGPTAVFDEVAPVLAGDQAMASFAADDLAVTDAYAFALSGGNTEVTSYLDDGLTAFRLTVFFPYVSNSDLDRIADEVTSIVDRHLGHLTGASAALSGLSILWSHMDEAIYRGQIASVLTMTAACFGIFLVSLRRWPVAIVATFVNVLPVAAIAALLGATGRAIDMATVFIMSLSFGVAIDDTSFFVHGYLGRPPGGGTLADTMQHTGPAMVATTLVVAVGFSLLLASSFVPMRTFGGFTALGVSLAMLCDVLVLPVLLALVVRGRRG